MLNIYIDIYNIKKKSENSYEFVQMTYTLPHHWSLDKMTKVVQICTY